MNRNMDDVANANTNSDHDPDFKTFWKQLHGKELPPKTVFTPQCTPAEQTDCYSVTPKRMEYWDMAVEAGYTYDDLESMRRHKHIALSPHVLLTSSRHQSCGRMRIRYPFLEFGTIDQFGEEDKQAIRFVIRLAAEHPLEVPFDRGIELNQSFVEMKQLHDIPLVSHRVDLWHCDLVDCDNLMFNISQNSKHVVLNDCKLANGGADLCRWLSPNNCSITEASFASTRITCDSLAKLLQSNKRINKLEIDWSRLSEGQRIYLQQEIEQIIQLLSDSSRLKKLTISNLWNALSRQERGAWVDILISLLGNKSLSCLTYWELWKPDMSTVPPETLSAQMKALQQALEQTTQLINFYISLRLPNEHARVYNALVPRILWRNYRNTAKAMLCSLPTWSRPLTLFGEMLIRTSRHWNILGTSNPTNETFHLLLQGSEMLKRAWDDKRADRLVQLETDSTAHEKN